MISCRVTSKVNTTVDVICKCVSFNMLQRKQMKLKNIAILKQCCHKIGPFRLRPSENWKILQTLLGAFWTVLTVCNVGFTSWWHGDNNLTVVFPSHYQPAAPSHTHTITSLCSDGSPLVWTDSGKKWDWAYLQEGHFLVVMQFFQKWLIRLFFFSTRCLICQTKTQTQTNPL